MRLAPRYMVVALATVVASVARAQFQPVVMRNAAPRSAEIVTGRWDPGTTVGVDLMALNSGATPGASWWAHGDLLNRNDPLYTSPASAYSIAAGWFDASSSGTEPDVLWGRHVTSPAFAVEVGVSWSAAKGAAPDTFADLTGNWVWGAAPVRLLPRPQPVALLVSSPVSTSVLRSQVTAVDLADARLAPATQPPFLPWALPAAVDPHATASDGDSTDRVFAMALSPAARAAGVEDAVIALAQGFYLLWHDSAPASATLAGLDVRAVEFGQAGFLALTSGGFLPPGAPAELDVLGAAPFDVDGDGVPDLVFSYGSESPVEPGWLLWIRNGGDVDAMRAQRPWGSLREHPDLAVISDAGALRPLDLGPAGSAFAVFDRSADAVFVVRGNGAQGFDVERLPVPGGATVRDMVAADVVGSPERDLIVTADFATSREIWVFPDEDDLAPNLTWAPPPPTTAPIGIDLPLSVEASDPDSPPPTVTWLRPSHPDQLGSSVVIDGGSLCDPAAPLELTVRALDDLGVYVLLAASVALEERPSLGIEAVPGSGRIVVRPGGATGWAQGEAWPRCGGNPTFEWSEVGLTGLTRTVTGAGSTTRNDFTIPESAYPDLLDGDAALSLRAFDGAGRDGTVALPLEPDARELVSGTVSFDRAALSPGEVAIARATIESRVGVPLPGVRIAFRLDGLAFAGPVEARGASALPGTEGEVVLGVLPPIGTPVELRVPVRSLGRPGAVAVEVFSQGSFRLSPESAPVAAGGAVPGCGCGDRGVGPIGLLLVLGIAARARARGTPRRGPGGARGDRPGPAADRAT